MNSKKLVLHRMMDVLIDEWGVAEVEAALLRSSRFQKNKTERSNRRIDGSLPYSPKPQRPRAVNLVENEDIKEDKREPLLFIANRFDSKEFLPSVADVREFIILAGRRPASMKDRTEAFGALLRILKELPSERLVQIAHAALHSGPSELGAISDAIAAAGARMARRSPDDPLVDTQGSSEK